MMLIRLVLENVFSFGERRSFSMLPNTGFKTLKHHIYTPAKTKVLKQSAIYGANGAGKSNLINALRLLQETIITGKVPFELINGTFKFHKENKPQLLATEFIVGEQMYLYALELFEGQIRTEELYLSGMGKKEDTLIFERTSDETGKSSLRFAPKIEKDKEVQVIKEVLLTEFINPITPAISSIAKRKNVLFNPIKEAYAWFIHTLRVISPDSKPQALTLQIEQNKNLKDYAEKLMRSFNIGIDSLGAESKSIFEFFGEDNQHEAQKFIEHLQGKEGSAIPLRTKRGDEIIIVNEQGNIVVKRLKVGHQTLKADTVFFNLEEESDGTIRLLDFIPAFKELLHTPSVYVIDEIERSIHPLLIKELVKKFSHDQQTQGQLIFSTHESNLLDQDLFRQDEIWFVEKDQNGATDLYALSEFKEHKTIDIRKGYLNGRYGSIPFLGNLTDLNWNRYATA